MEVILVRGQRSCAASAAKASAEMGDRPLVRCPMGARAGAPPAERVRVSRWSAPAWPVRRPPPAPPARQGSGWRRAPSRMWRPARPELCCAVRPEGNLGGIADEKSLPHV